MQSSVIIMHSTQGVYIARDNIFVEIPGKIRKKSSICNWRTWKFNSGKLLIYHEVFVFVFTEILSGFYLNIYSGTGDGLN